MTHQFVQPGEQEMRLVAHRALHPVAGRLERLQPVAQPVRLGARQHRDRRVVAEIAILPHGGFGQGLHRGRPRSGMDGQNRYSHATIIGNRAETTTWETEHAETHFPGGLGRDTGLARGGAGGEPESTEIHPAVGPGDSGSGVDHGLRDAQPRLHGVRHAVWADRQGVRLQGHAADGRRPRHRERRQDLEADPARRPAVPQRRAGAGERLRRLHQALGRARCVRPGAAGAHRRTRPRRTTRPSCFA